jgi:hypothetical protein
MESKFHIQNLLRTRKGINQNKVLGGIFMEEKEFHLNDVVEMKKQHPCGTNRWKIIRMGMDIRIKCEGCGHSVMIPRREFSRKMKKILVKAED